MSTPVEYARLRAELDDMTQARDVAAACADRFRDVLCEALDLATNPGDDALVARLRAVFGKHGPEPTRWRDALAGYRAAIDSLATRPALPGR